jgi:hypothetical protein
MKTRLKLENFEIYQLKVTERFFKCIKNLLLRAILNWTGGLQFRALS